MGLLEAVGLLVATRNFLKALVEIWKRKKTLRSSSNRKGGIE